jgi:hypothetical protein
MVAVNTSENSFGALPGSVLNVHFTGSLICEKVELLSSNIKKRRRYFIAEKLRFLRQPKINNWQTG